MTHFEISIPQTSNTSPKVMLSWILRGFVIGICECYIPIAPRRVEAFLVAKYMIQDALDKQHITEEEFEELSDVMLNASKIIPDNMINILKIFPR